MAQALAHGERLDKLFAGAPSWTVNKMPLPQMAMSRSRMGIMVLDVKCALLDGKLRRRIDTARASTDDKCTSVSVALRRCFCTRARRLPSLAAPGLTTRAWASLYSARSGQMAEHPHVRNMPCTHVQSTCVQPAPIDSGSPQEQSREARSNASSREYWVVT